MDGGVRQEEMAEQLKREVKERGHRRSGERAVDASPGDRASEPKIMDISSDRTEPCPEPQPSSTSRPQRGADCTLTNMDTRGGVAFERSDTILLMFYLEHVLPFLFPFYRPSPLEGGRSWILEMMISSPVVRQTALCQSSYFFSLARGTPNHDELWETVLAQTRDAFGVLRQALQVIDGSNISEHLHGAVRIMASIMQVQRFEIAVLSFDNCQAHLNAALALFKQLLDSPDTVEPAAGLGARFNAVLRRLGPLLWVLPTQSAQVLSAEQAAFRFSSTLLIFDDIIASTVLQEEPRLYEYHRSLLGDTDTVNPPINLEATVGCQNWALLQIGEIAVLDAWKQRRKRAGSLNVMELVQRATAIQGSLENHLTALETSRAVVPKENSGLLGVFTADYDEQSSRLASQSTLITCIWAHAALIYLSIVVSGWQPASVEVRCRVTKIIELLTLELTPRALLRTMVWPFCVAGCLAEPAQEARLRCMVEALQPPSVFGTVRKAVEIMENVWRNRDVGDGATRDLTTCFRSQGDLVLLV